MAVPAFEVNVEHLQSLPPDKQKEELAKLAFVNQGFKDNPLWSFVPHDGDGGKTSWGQQGFLSIDTFMGAFVAGNQSGKTHVGCAKILIQALPREFLPPWLQKYKVWDVPGAFRGRVVGVDLPNWLDKVMLPKFRALTPPAALYKGEFDKAFQERTRKLTFADGSFIDFLTHDMDIDAYAGATLHYAWLDEEPPGHMGRMQFEETLTRLLVHDGWLRVTMTPLLGLGWMFSELTDQFGNPRDDDEVRVVTGAMDDNPHMSEKMRERLKKRWAENDPMMLEARVKGRWVHFAGLIYPDFRDDEPIVVPDRPIPRANAQAKPEVPVYCGIDPGINKDHKAAMVFAWLDPDDVMEVFWAQKFQDLNVEQIAEIYWAVLKEFDFTPRWNVIDPSSRNRNAATGRSMQWAFEQQRIFTIPGQNDRRAGFNEITTRLQTGRLKIHRSCEQLRDEFQKYRWKQARGQTEDAAKPEPIKINDDLLDALRYLAMSMPVKARGPEVPDDRHWQTKLVQDDIAKRTRPRKQRIGSRR